MDNAPTAEDDDGWDESEGLLPEQYADVAARFADDPSRRLWLAVLVQAIIALDRGARDMYRDWAWVASDADYPGSFVFICEALDLDTSRWREAVLVMARRPRGRPQRRRDSGSAAAQREAPPAEDEDEHDGVGALAATDAAIGAA